MVLAVRIIGICIILLSALPTGALGTYFYVKTSNFLERAQETTATVVGFKESQSKGTTMYQPIFSFVDENDKPWKAVSSMSSHPCPYDKGEKVSLLYDPDDPSNVEVNVFWRLWLGAVIAGGMAALAFLIGLAFLILGPIIIRAIFKDVGRIKQGEPIA